MRKRRPSGDGMVRKREDNRWEGSIVIGHREDRKPIYKYFSARTEAELMRKMNMYKQEYKNVDLCEGSRMLLSEWLDRWINEFAALAVRPSTLAGYRKYLDDYVKPRLGNKPVSKVTTADIQKLYRDVQAHGRTKAHPEFGHALSPATIRSMHGVLHQAMDAAVREHLIAHNPTQGVTLPAKETTTKTILSNEQLTRFMDVIQSHPEWFDLFYTEITTGLRRGELCGLQWKDFFEAEDKLCVRRSAGSLSS